MNPVLPFKKYPDYASLQADRQILSDLLGSDVYQEMLSTSSSKIKIPLPGLLKRFPPVIELHLSAVRRKVIQETGLEIVDITSLDPAELVHELARHVSGDSGESTGPGYETDSAAFLRIGLTQYAKLREHILSFIKTGRTSIPLHEVKSAVVAYALLLQENSDIVNALKNTDDSGENARGNALAELIFVRVRTFLESMCTLNPCDAVKRIKFRIQKSSPNAAVRTMLTQQLTSIRTWEDYTRQAEDEIPRTLMAKKVDTSIQKRILGMMKSGLDDCRKADSLWRDWFLSGGLATWQKLYTPQKLSKVEVPFARRVIMSITETRTVSLYPAKDWLDLKKGVISRDCTSGGIGMSHIKTPEFFNLRMYEDGVWRGNIYCLDLTGNSGDLLIDRVQVPNKFDRTWVNFLPQLAQQLAEVVDSIYVRRILGPKRISNHQVVQGTFDKYLESIKDVQKVNNPYSGIKRLSSFESVRLNKKLVVLWERDNKKK